MNNVNKTSGCQIRTYNHDGEEIVIDQCICTDDLCNKEMQEITSTTSATTTHNGKNDF